MDLGCITQTNCDQYLCFVKGGPIRVYVLETCEPFGRLYSVDSE